MAKNAKQCCLCGDECEAWPGGHGFGNNPFPLCAWDDEDSRCCDGCNGEKVLLARVLWNEFCQDMGTKDRDGARRIHPAWRSAFLGEAEQKAVA